MEYKCTICIKDYKSYQSLWNHNNKFHNIKSHNIVKKCTKNVQEIKELSKLQQAINSTKNTNFTKNVKSVSNKNFNCVHCNKIFSRKFCGERHEKNCKLKSNNLNELELLKKN